MTTCKAHIVYHNIYSATEQHLTHVFRAPLYCLSMRVHGWVKHRPPAAVSNPKQKRTEQQLVASPVSAPGEAVHRESCRP